MTIVAEICGHGSDTGSTSQQSYGSFPDEVLRREAQKVWNFIESLLGWASPSILISPSSQYVMADLAPA